MVQLVGKEVGTVGYGLMGTLMLTFPKSLHQERAMTHLLRLHMAPQPAIARPGV
jgi:hypothetical protein